ncbi:lantibiotic biosynthesis dehydratase-like protein [Ancylomarina subtilis]|uniref:Lantibiotic biosynthesis dehydratase-like protein n=1 Tax=Ancylomarina subtilis TaxID=1639035 RepID=A0A4V2FTC6_9BACT|nr:lantibiotic dehydratase family protein [Ancylomarina subtilis]RZT97555.1 lantibiotic biosynthesis dehydratase-like protein [Ancylomarina subtilis]
MKIKAFNKFILRTPLFPIDNIGELKIDSLFEEAVYLSSPDLYTLGIKNYKPSEKQQLAIFKYWRRSCCRCTPFGLFAGCSIGKISDENNILLKKRENYERQSRLDMRCLDLITETLKKIPEVIYGVKFFANSSIYESRDNLRYIECKIDEKLIRRYELISVNFSEYLKLILDEASSGSTFINLVNLLVSNDIPINDSEEFIHELIRSQLLVSELDLQVTGSNPLKRMINILSHIKPKINILDSLVRIQNELVRIDSCSSDHIYKRYDLIQKELRRLIPDISLKNFLQVDSFKPTKKCILSQDIVEDVKKGIMIIDKINNYTHGSPQNLINFKNQFRERYGDRQIPLLDALDVESGIGYNSYLNLLSDNSEIIEGIEIPSTSKDNMVLSEAEVFFYRKMNQALSMRQMEIQLTEDDLKDFKDVGSNLPLTFSAVIELSYSKDKKLKIGLGEVGGSSASNLLSRFGSSNDKIKTFACEICDKEKELIGNNKIIAEVVHLPESRFGNVLLRPTLREYEIPFLSKSSVDIDNQIKLNEIMVSIENDRILLFSTRLKKEIIPRLSSAFNYMYNTQHVYQFLGDMQYQDVNTNLSFTWGQVERVATFLPRVSYKNIIFSPATWIILDSDLQILNLKEDLIVEKFKEYREINNIPTLVNMEEGDKKLILNLNDSNCVKILINTLHRNKSVKLLETFDQEHLVKGSDGSYSNEFILSFYSHE